MYIKNNRYLETPHHIIIDGEEVFKPTHEQLISNSWQYLTDDEFNTMLEEKAFLKRKEDMINALKDELMEYDYIGVKIAMGVATKDEYAEKIAYTETLRERINKIQVATKAEDLEDNIEEA